MVKKRRTSFMDVPRKSLCKGCRSRGCRGCHILAYQLTLFKLGLQIMHNKFFSPPHPHVFLDFPTVLCVVSPLIDLGTRRRQFKLQSPECVTCSDGIIGSWDEIVLKSATRLLQKSLFVNSLWVHASGHVVDYKKMTSILQSQITCS